MHKKILVAIDIEDTKQPATALDAAADLANFYKASVHLFHVIPTIPAYVEVEMPSESWERTRSTTDAMMKAYADSDRFKGVKTTYSVAEGDVYRSVLDAAEENGADLIVICAHRKGFADFLIGSNAARIVSHAKCSVYVVRD